MTDQSKITEIKIIQENLNRRFPDFEQPRISGYFSVNKNREYVPDISQLKYFYNPYSKNRSIYLDLNKGIENCNQRPEDLDEKLDHLLNFVARNIQQFYNNSNKM